MLPGSYLTLGGPESKSGLHDKMTANNRLRHGNHEIHISQNWAHISQLTGRASILKFRPPVWFRTVIAVGTQASCAQYAGILC